MRILVTNDDGIHAPGLEVLRTIALQLSEDVWVVAPETEQSGASHSLTLNDPLRMRELDHRTFAVQGTPTDCVIMGVRHLLQDHTPDLVLSGVNRGQNIADDITYSGTIAGAFEGALLGIPSIALSLAFGFGPEHDTKWETPAALGRPVIEKLLAVGWPRDIVMNVNFPDVLPDEVLEMVVTRQGKRDQNLLHIDQRHDTRHKPYFWVGFGRHKSEPAEGTDLWAVYTGRISVTPLTLNLTHHESCARLSQKFGG